MHDLSAPVGERYRLQDGRCVDWYKAVQVSLLSFLFPVHECLSSVFIVRVLILHSPDMDPLSVSASIIGITTAAVRVGRLLKPFIDGAYGAPTSARSVLMEVTGIYAYLHQLRGFLIGNEEAAKSRRSLIMIEQVIIVFTDCVSIFSELEQTLESLKTGEHMRLIDRMKWVSKETALSKLIARLQASKASLNFMLTILTW